MVAGISNLLFGPRPAWVFFTILFLIQRFASLFPGSASVFRRHRGNSDAIFGSNSFFTRMQRYCSLVSLGLTRSAFILTFSRGERNRRCLDLLNPTVFRAEDRHDFAE